MLILFVLILVGSSVAGNGREKSVLLVNGLYTGHLLPLLSLGEELVKRGHEVTLVANVLNGSHTYPDLPERVGVKFISAGYDPFWTKDSLREFHRQLYYGGMGSGEQWNKIKKAVFTSSIQIREKVEELGTYKFDIVVCDFGISMVGAYFHVAGMKSVVLNTVMGGTETSDLEWPTPQSMTGQSQDLSIAERFLNIVIIRPLYRFVISSLVSALSVEDPAYKKVVDAGGIDVVGTNIPLIMTCTFGYEYPRARLPLVEYVGPIVSSFPPEMDEELREWLDSKPPKSVIFASMGTTITMSAANARAIVHGVLESNPSYSVVMVIEKGSNVLDEFRIYMYSGRLYASEWVAQQTLLKHHSLLISILHCGQNGAHESILSNVPIICMPLLFDQFDVSARVSSAGVGISLYGKMDIIFGEPNVTAEIITSAVRIIVRHDYAKNLSRLNKMNNLAGGVRRAADLVEFYEEVGYDHLVPAFVKYEWSWWQYYNYDVWVLLVVTLGLVFYGIYHSVRRILC